MVAVKGDKLNKIQATALMHDYFDWLQESLNDRHPLKKEELDRFFSPQFKLTTNRQVTAKHLQDYAYRLDFIKKRYAQFEIADVAVELLADEHKILVSHNLHLTDRNSKTTQVQSLSIVTFENHKMTDWVEITNEEGSARWDKK